MTDTRKRLALVSMIWAIFFVFGFQLAGIGPLLRAIADRTSVSVETVGIFFTVQSIAAIISASAIGTVIERFSIRPAILIGLTCVGVGLFGIVVATSFPVLLIAAAFIGFGVGFMDVGGQFLVMALYGDKSARPLNSLHFLFSVGAVIGPILAGRYGIDTLWIGVAIFAAVLPALYLSLPRGIYDNGSAAADANAPSLYRSPVLWLFGVVILLYVGLEVGVGSWTTEYLNRSAGLDRVSGAEITSVYWFTFMISRLVVTAVGHRLTFQRQLLYGISLSIVGGVVYVLTVGSVPGTIVATIIIGFGFGPIYAAVFAIVTTLFSGAAGRAAGVIGVAGSIGYMVIVPLQGVLLERAGGRTMTIYVTALTIAMLVCLLAARRSANAR